MWLNRYFSTWYCNWQVWEVTARTQAGFIPGTHSYSTGIEPRSPGYRRTQATRVALHGTVLLLCPFPSSSFNVNDPPLSLCEGHTPSLLHSTSVHIMTSARVFRPHSSCPVMYDFRQMLWHCGRWGKISLKLFWHRARFWQRSTSQFASQP